MEKVNKSLIWNCIIFILVVFATVGMMLGFEFMGHSDLLSSTHISVFKFFTVDSNLFIGFASLLLLIQECLFIKTGKKIPKIYYLLKYMATCSVCLTMLITLCFLAPFSVYKFTDFYMNSNLFYHFIIPVLSVISFVLYEKQSFSIIDSLYSLLPMACYGVFYMFLVIPHIQNGMVSYDYDFYGFLRGGAQTVFWVIPLLFIVMYIIGYGIYFFHEKWS